MKQHEYAKLGRIIQNTNPELFQGILILMEPKLKDTSAISKMYSQFCINHNPKNDFNDKLTFISAIINLYCPSALLLNCRLNNRVCLTLAKVMDYNLKQSLTRYINQSRVYIKNPNFREKIETVCSELREVA